MSLQTGGNRSLYFMCEGYFPIAFYIVADFFGFGFRSANDGQFDHAQIAVNPVLVLVRAFKKGKTFERIAGKCSAQCRLVRAAADNFGGAGQVGLDFGHGAIGCGFRAKATAIDVLVVGAQAKGPRSTFAIRLSHGAPRQR